MSEAQAREEIGPYALADQLSNDLARAMGRPDPYVGPADLNSAPATSVRELARELGVAPKKIRAWMRRQNWRSAVEHGQTWIISPEQASRIRDRFGDAPEELAGSTVDDPNPEATVGELLTAYRGILGSLRTRGLVRTNNAPIGDLAEYCAAVVYDGLLAPNSEKSYDLVAEDGRRVQVKVRVIRHDTRPSSSFSVLRSFDFDACLFLLIGEEENDVIAARELSVDEVQQLGRHRDHTNGTALRVGRLKSTDLGVDRTSEFRAAWQELLQVRSLV
jgi:hypothetical protein